MNGLADFGADYKERVEKAIALLQQGKGILLVDDDDRENEGDIIYAAQNMSVADMALMIRECSGIVCLCITPERAKALELRPMVTGTCSRWWQSPVACSSAAATPRGRSTSPSWPVWAIPPCSASSPTRTVPWRACPRSPHSPRSMG